MKTTPRLVNLHRLTSPSTVIFIRVTIITSTISSILRMQSKYLLRMEDCPSTPRTEKESGRVFEEETVPKEGC